MKETSKILSLTVFMQTKSRSPLCKRLSGLCCILRLHVMLSYFLVSEQIFLIFLIGIISFEVQNPNASCRASVSSDLVYNGW